MTNELKNILVRAIILKLNEALIKKNKYLCSQNMHSEQIKLHGGSMYLKLILMSDKKINKIAGLSGL